MTKQPGFKFTFFKDGATSLNDLDQALIENFRQNSTEIRKQMDRLIIHNVKLNDLMDDGAVLTDDMALFTKLMAMSFVLLTFLNLKILIFIYKF